MRRFSQRNSLVTLNEINITPLLDLAFVLLIIFVITTPLLEQSLNLNLPQTVINNNKMPRKEDIKVVEVDRGGGYVMGKTKMSLDQIEAELVRVFQANPNLVVSIRADRTSPLDYVAQLLDRCERRGITQVSISTEPKR
jgi:biopolymer transport protein ExbD